MKATKSAPTLESIPSKPKARLSSGGGSEAAGTTQRWRRPRLVRDPDDWQKGWVSNPVHSVGPRWSMRGPPKDSGKPRPAGGSHRDRDTWIQQAVGSKAWVPAPGTYKSECEFLLDPKDQVDSNLTKQERAANFSFSREVKESGQKLEEVKNRRNSHRYPKLTNDFTPGPGRYVQYSTFGAPSGASRTSSFGGRGKSELIYKSVPDLNPRLAQVPPRNQAED